VLSWSLVSAKSMFSGQPISFLDWIARFGSKKSDKQSQAVKDAMEQKHSNGSHPAETDKSSASSPAKQSGDITPSSRGMPANTQQPGDTAADEEKMGVEDKRVRIFTPRVFAMGMIVSIGGLIFGYDTGQISGFLEMDDFLRRFGNTTNADGGPAFTNVRSGTIVALLSIGTLIGAIGAAPIADGFGRRITIIVGCIIFCVGVIVQIATENAWYQIAIGRWVAGLGVGMLSVLTPMYQSETAPRQVRGALVSAYQLFITFGIFLAYCINFGTETNTGTSQWRIPMGIGFIFPLIMACGIMFVSMLQSTTSAFR